MNLKIGSIVRFKDVDTIHELQLQGKVYFGWTHAMDHLCGQTREITKEILEERHDSVLWKEHCDNGIDWWISADMIELVE